MKTTKGSIGVMFISVMVMLASCNNKNSGPKPEMQPPKTEQEVAKVDSEKGAIPHSEKINLKLDANSAYVIVRNDTNDGSQIRTAPLFIDPIINAKDIYDFYMNNNEAGKFTCIRFYPAYDTNKLYLIMCLAEGPVEDLTKKEEKKYISLINNNFLNPGSIFDSQFSLTRDQALLKHNDYFKNVLLYGTVQNPQPAPNDTIRYSRTYEWTDFLKLLTDNSISTNQLNQYYFQFEIGYVSNKMAQKIQTRSRVLYSTAQNQGFTVLIHLKDNLGNSMIDPFSKINEADPTDKFNYKNRYLEVGHPCPPRCGVLHQ